MTAAAISTGREVTWPLYSCDDHLDLWALPPDLWESRLPARYRDRGPRVVDHDGVPTWLVGGVRSEISGQRARPRGALARAGLGDDDLRPSDPVKRLADMDLDGLQATVIYGPSIAGLALPDPELKAACWRVWNDWSAEFNACSPDRLAVLPVLPTHDPGAAAAELERVAALGHRGALVYCYEFRPGDREWDRLWRAAESTGLPLSFHIGGSAGTLRLVEGSWEGTAYGAVVPMSLAEPFAVMVFSGALERHPGLTLVLAEAGLGWLPYFVHRMDGRMAKRANNKDYQLQQMPSEIFRRQVLVTFEEEQDGTAYLRMLGPERFMWASDYPHVDSTFPHSRQAIADSLPGLDEGACRALTADTCRRLYRFP
jgi:predicted TIM-barrel fold metal-dependent hydrolase